jgi:hypothetical protein
MADIFISYKREDRRFAERLSIALEQLGFDVWWDFELLSGDRFRKVIEKVIDECTATIVLWSQLSRDSTFVVDEATYARDQNKLCPARIDNCRLPLGFGGDHVVSLSDWDGEMGHEGLQALLRALEAKTGKKARLGARPRDTDDQARFAEMEAFKAAQAVENLSALHAFLRDFPNGAFAKFVRSQVEGLEARAPKVAARAAAPDLTPPPEPRRSQPESEPRRGASPPPAPPPYTAPESWPAKGPPWAIIGIGGALAIAVIALVVTIRPWDNAELPSMVTEEVEPAEAAPAAYDVAQLHPGVRRAVEQAREAEQQANAAATRARDAAALADDAARRARAGEEGFRVQTYADGDRYEGGFSGGVRNGVGVYLHGDVRLLFDRYAGQWSAGRFSGAGVYTYSNTTSNGLRYEGESANNQRSGFGVFYWRDGGRYVGGWHHEDMSGPGVHYYADGRRYEGEWANDRYSGHGVLWDANGRVSQAGIWTNDQLTQALTP